MIILRFWPQEVNPIPYKDYFSFLCETLDISNNEKKQKRGEVVTILGIELAFGLMEAWLSGNKPEKAKLWVARMLNNDVIAYNNLQSIGWAPFLCGQGSSTWSRTSSAPF